MYGVSIVDEAFVHDLPQNGDIGNCHWPMCASVCLSEFTAPDRTSSIFCKVYFAEEFQHLRELVFPSGEDRWVERRRWEEAGGVG